MRVAIRVDASTQIGSGHVVRCATLADCIKARGADVTFLCRELPGHYCDWIEARGHAVLRLPAAGEPYQELPAARGALAGAGPFDWLVVDHYALEAVWEAAMRPVAAKIMAIDDLADRSHEADILLDQNLPADPSRYDGRVPASCLRLIGPRFALLRPEFVKMRSNLPPRDGKIRRVLVFLGGGDARNVTCKILDSVAEAGLTGVAVDVVLGQNSPHLESVRERCKALSECKVHVQTGEMEQLMANADVMIGGAGSTTWERFCLGLPAIIVSVAANQKRVAMEAARRRAAVYLGDDETIAGDRIADTLRSLASRPRLLRRMGARAMAVTDGVGAERVASVLLGDRDDDGDLLWLRPASLTDASFVYSVRSDARLVKYFFNQEPIAWNDHLDWFTRAIRQAGRTMLIAENRSGYLGILRLDQTGQEVEVSVSLQFAHMGRNFGPRLLRLAARWAQLYLHDVKRLNARIRPENTVSVKAFEKAGYRERYRCYSYEIEPGHGPQ